MGESLEDRIEQLLLPVYLTPNGWVLPLDKVEEFKRDLIEFIKKEIENGINY